MIYEHEFWLIFNTKSKTFVLNMMNDSVSFSQAQRFSSKETAIAYKENHDRYDNACYVVVAGAMSCDTAHQYS